MTLVRIDSRRITDWESFHDEFAKAFGFAGHYGRNMNAWIDCLSYLNDPDFADTIVKAPAGGVVTLQLDHAAGFRERCPDIYDAVVEASAFVNWRQVQAGCDPVIALSFHKDDYSVGGESDDGAIVNVSHRANDF